VIMAPRRGETFQQFVEIAVSMSLCPNVSQIYDEVVWNLHLQVSCFMCHFDIIIFLCLLLVFNFEQIDLNLESNQ